MKVSLYVINPQIKETIERRWKWYVSLDIAVDAHYWSYDRHITAYITEQVSLGIALELRMQLSEITTKHPDLSDELIINKWNKSLSTSHLVLNKGFGFDNLSSQTIPDPFVMKMLSRQLQGRALLRDELLQLIDFLEINHISKEWRSYVQALYLAGDVDIMNGLRCKERKTYLGLRHQKIYTCRRCGSGEDAMYWSYCVSCKRDCAYCEACLNMGRARFCSLLICGSKVNAAAAQPLTNFNPITSLSKWNLSPAQTEAATEGLKFLHVEHEQRFSNCFLIWAVTGAGKTEMIFPLIEAECKRGGRVALTTPRKDVVIELQPRIKKAFPAQTLVTLYGGSEQRWDAGDITLATTHQFMRFWKKFDLIIIDEIDAYPFHNNPMLEFAVLKSCTDTGRYVLLSATPPDHMRKAVSANKLPHAKVSVRYHRHPLPVPKLMHMKPLTSLRALPRALHREIHRSIERDAQIFLFVPKIKYIDAFLRLLRTAFESIEIEGTSSQDTERSIKVEQFRKGRIRLLVTTTILERGVTIPKTDVFVLDADCQLFDEASLVQMAGRAGRSSLDPKGRVFFIAYDKTKSQIKAVKHIKGMNKLARKKAYLLSE